MLVTTCPKCQTTFRVTEEILAQASGQVRCGRCAHVFGGRTSLREQEETPTRHVSTLLQRAPAGEESEPEGELANGHGNEPQNTLAIGQAEEPAAGLAGSDAAQRPDDELADESAPLPDASSIGAASGITRSWILWDPPPRGAGPAGSDDDDDDTAAGAFAESETFAGGEPDAASEAAIRDEEPEPAADVLAGHDPSLDETAEHRMPAFEPEPQRRTRLWATGSALLVLLLAVQVIHHFRATLAELPGVGPAVAGAYDMLGIAIAPAVDFDQYTTLDLTAVAEPAGGERGWLIIETRIRNRGPRVQPYPHIFLTLIDRWQETIAGRYFAPEEYIVTTTSDYSSMNAGRTVDAQFIIADPGPSATGFELEFCTPAGEGFVCESDVESE